jgi:hypothetical protein
VAWWIRCWVRSGAELLPSPGGGDDEATQFLAAIEVAQLTAGDQFALMFDQPKLLPAQLGGVEFGGEDQATQGPGVLGVGGAEVAVGG